MFVSESQLISPLRFPLLRFQNAKKRPSTSSGSEAGIGGGTAGGADNGSDSKRARVSPELESGSSGGGGAGVCNGSGSARPHRSDSSSLGGGGRSVSGGAAVANGGGAGMRVSWRSSQSQSKRVGVLEGGMFSDLCFWEVFAYLSGGCW